MADSCHGNTFLTLTLELVSTINMTRCILLKIAFVLDFIRQQFTAVPCSTVYHDCIQLYAAHSNGYFSLLLQFSCVCFLRLVVIWAVLFVRILGLGLCVFLCISSWLLCLHFIAYKDFSLLFRRSSIPSGRYSRGS